MELFKTVPAYLKANFYLIITEIKVLESFQDDRL